MCSKCRKDAETGKKLLTDPEYPAYPAEASRLDKRYHDTWANCLALAFAEARPALTKSQLRAFYGHVKRLEAALQLRQRDDLTATLNEFVKMKPLAHARMKRERIPHEFKTFIDRNVDACETREQVLGFARHFAAVAAYCEGRIKDEGKGRE